MRKRLLGRMNVAVLVALLAVVTASCGHDGTRAASAPFTLLQVDDHGALAYDPAGGQLLGLAREGRRLSEVWRRDLPSGQMLDVTCFGECPRAALLLQDPAASTGSRVELTDARGRSADAWAEEGRPLRIFRWRQDSALFVRQRGTATEAVARRAGREVVLPVHAATSLVEADPAGDTVVVADAGATTVLTVRAKGTWETVSEIPGAATAACVAPAGDRVLVMGDADVTVDVPGGATHRAPAALAHPGACALAGGWTVKGALGTVNGAPSSEWVSQHDDSRVQWRQSYRQLGRVLMAPSGKVACLAFDDRPVCRTAEGTDVDSPEGTVVQAGDGRLVYLDGDGLLREFP